MLRPALAVVILLLTQTPALAATDIASTLSFVHMKDQLRGANGESGGALFQNTAVALWTTASYELGEGPFSLGGFFLVERGTRICQDYAGVDSGGTPQVTDKSGGPYTQLWLGPAGRVRFRAMFLEAGYVLVGIRKDEGRAFVPSVTGDTTSAFETELGRAWLFGLGGTVALQPGLSLVLKVEYRYQYYDSRGGEKLANGLHLGTQAVRPHVGLSWRL